MRNWIGVFLGLLLFSGRAVADAPPVAVVVTSDAGEPAASYFATQIERPITRREMAEGQTVEELIVAARRNWSEDLVVIFDVEHARVKAIRLSDGVTVARALEAEAVASPYALGLAAAELLELVENAPAPVQAEPVPPAPPPRARQPDAPSKEPEPLPVDAGLHPMLSAGLAAAQSVDGDTGLVQPIVGFDLRFSSLSSPLWYSAGLHAAGLFGRSYEQLLELPTGRDLGATVEYERTELSLRLALAHEHDQGAIVGAFDFGISWIAVTARDQYGDEVAHDRRTAFWSGPGIELRREVTRGIWAALGARLAFFPVASRFFGSPANSPTKLRAFQEGHLDSRAHLAIVWDMAP